MRNDIDIEYFKKSLEDEMVLVERELSELGQKTRVTDGVDWEATAPKDFDTDSADESEVADKMEELEENSAVLNELEAKYNQIKKALKKMEEGTYGNCEVCGEPIEEDRLIANPAATTCKQHMN